MSMDQINSLYQALSEAKKELDSAQAVLDQKQDNFGRLSKDLGDILHTQGLSQVKMADGRELGLETTYYGSAPQDRIPGIRSYLQAINNVGILKPKKLSIKEEDIASLPVELQPKVEYEINTNTLKAFLKEQAKKGELDQSAYELFGVYTVNKVILGQ